MAPLSTPTAVRAVSVNSVAPRTLADTSDSADVASWTTAGLLWRNSGASSSVAAATAADMSTAGLENSVHALDSAVSALRFAMGASASSAAHTSAGENLRVHAAHALTVESGSFSLEDIIAVM